MWLWLFNIVALLMMYIFFGAHAGICFGIYISLLSFFIYRYIRFAERVIDAQCAEIERLRRK